MRDNLIYGRAWRKVRARVLERDGYECQIRLPGCSGVADQVDHRVEVRLGGAAYDPQNLRAACRKCNNARKTRRRGRFVETERNPSRDW